MQPKVRDTLAPWTYLSEEFFELESSLFKKHWMLAGHVSDLQQAGDFITFNAVGERAIVIVDDGGEIRGFHNVCRHRGATLLNETGQCKHRISCPFHGWSYAFDGSLLSYPLPDTFKNLNKQDYGLKPLQVEVWQGLVFVNFSADTTPLADQFQHLEAEIQPYRIAEMQPLMDQYDVLKPYNWKVIHDIDNEGYHVPIGHPSLQQLYGKTYKDHIQNGVPVSDAIINDKPAQLWSVRHYQKLLPNFEHLPLHRQKSWWYIGIFPNAVIGLYPEMVEYYMTIPVAVDKTRYIGRTFGLPDGRAEVAACRFLNHKINGATEQEDESFVQDMQEGMRSSVFPEPTLSDVEHGVKYFHQRIQQLFPVATLCDEPESGSVMRCNAQMAK